MHYLVSTLAPAFICYFVFHHYEPCSPWSLATLLLAPPPLARILSRNHVPLLAAYAIHLSTIAISTLAYRLSPLHPLAKYPGPRLASASKLWLAFTSLRGKQYLYYRDLHMRYGDIVRTGPNELSFIEPKYVNLILGTKGMPKGPHWDAHFCGKPAKGLVSIRDPIEHSMRRKRWQMAFTSQSLQEYEVFIEKRSSQLIDCLSRRVGQPLDLMGWINHFVFDFMMDVTFGGGSEMIRDGDTQGMWHIIEGAQPDSLFTSHVPWLARILAYLPRMNTNILAFRQLAIGRCHERIKSGAMNKDIMYYLTDEEGVEDTPPPLIEIFPDSVVAFLAGTDTSATTLSCLSYLLMTHPEKYQRLQEEIDTTTGYAFDTAVNANMPYLNAFINETLRLFPPLPCGSPRAPNVGSGGHMLAEHFIPEGTSVYIHTYTMQRDPRNFSSPDSFLPERWLPAGSRYAINRKNNKNFQHNPVAFIPFSHGPANCIGKHLAIQEMRALVRILTETFTMRFADGYDPSNWEKDMKDHFVVLKGKLPVILESRSC